MSLVLTPIQPHPFADRLPEMTPEELADLERKILALGQQHDIVLLDHEGEEKILDGRHRYLICSKHGIPPKFRKFGSRTSDGNDPALFVASAATHRNLTPVQKAVVAESFLDDVVAGRVAGPGDGGKASDYAADLFGCARAYVDQVRQVRLASPELHAKLRTGKLELKAALARVRHVGRAKEVRRVRTSAPATPHSCRLIHGDDVEEMAKLPDGSVRVIFADPPYNNGWAYRDDPHADRLDDVAYMQLMEAWMEQAHRLLADNGSLFAVIDDRYCCDFGMSLKSIGFHFRRLIVWHETFGNYNSAEGNLSSGARFIHYFSKTDKPLFNATELRVPSARQAVYNDPRANDHGRLPDSVWQISRITGNNAERVPWQDRGQAPQLPISVPERCILLASEPFDTVLDPFNGNGTTGIAALRNRRQYVGIDRDAVGLRRSEQWINSQLADHQAKQQEAVDADAD